MKNLIYKCYDLTTIVVDSLVFFAKNINNFLVELVVHLYFIHYLTTNVSFYAQYLIPTNWWPIHSDLPQRPSKSLDVYDLLLLNLLEVSVMIFFVLIVMIFNQHILPSSPIVREILEILLWKILVGSVKWWPSFL